MTGADIIKRYDSMNDYARGNWMNLWQECADWCLPINDNINRIRVSGQEKPVQRLIDFGISANFNFASGFFSHIFPTNSVWAKYRHPLPEYMEIKAVADYFEEVSRIIHNILVSSNFAQEEFQSLLCMGAFGTSCLSVEECDDTVVKFHNYVIDKIRIDENYKHNVDTVAREFELTARQAIQQFGEEALRAAELGHIVEQQERSGKDKFKFVHLICPREDYDKSKMDSANKPWKSLWVSRDSQQIIKEGGFDYMPYRVARFVTGNDEVYGRSPCSMKLGAFRRANVQERSVILAAERAVNEQWLVPDDDTVAMQYITSRPGAKIKFRAASPGGPPQPLPYNGNHQIGLELLQRVENEIKEGFFNHLFRPLEDYRNMTAFEVNERMTTDLMLLAPFVSRYIDEKVSPTMETVYYFAQKAGVLPDAPPELADSPKFEIDYVGRLGLAAKNFETMGAVSALRIMGEAGQYHPALLSWFDNIDADKFGNDIWYSQSASMNALKDPKLVEQEREARAQQAQQQQAVDNLAPMADAAQKMSGAVDPSSIVAQMTGE
jgi:hypothetical protein